MSIDEPGKLVKSSRWTQYGAVFSVARLLLNGFVLQSKNISVGRGKLIDWRENKSGIELISEDDEESIFEYAHLFVAMVGAVAAMKAAAKAEDLPTSISISEQSLGG